MITSFRIKNLRSILDSGAIRLARINILVGKNSSGKSTLLRTLPLLRQSIERPTKGPILWYGRLVDFGSYQNAVNATNKEAGIEFSFRMNLPRSARSESRRELGNLFIGTDQFAAHRTLRGVQLTVSMGLNASDEVGKVKRIQLNLGAENVNVEFDQDADISEVSINGLPVTLSTDRRWFAQAGKLIPLPMVAREESFAENDTRKYWMVENSPFLDRLVDSLSVFFHGNTSREKITEIARALRYGGESRFFDDLKGVASHSHSFIHNLSHYQANSETIRAVRQNVLLCSLTGIFRLADKEVSDFATSVRYVEPVRATAERYYRLQDLAVEEIDSRGENAAMFISSLSQREMNHLRDWMITKLGFYAHVEKGSGYGLVKVQTPDGIKKNIADLGFGYSQLLPIILQVWRSLVSPVQIAVRSVERPILAIEQPELHLHPQFQARMADVLAAVSAGSESGKASIFLETHSEHLINRFGQLVARGIVDKDDLQIIVVEAESQEKSSVRVVGFDDKGYLDSNWPSGFFVPEIV